MQHNAQIAADYLAGLSMKEIRRVHGVHLCAIYKAIDDCGVSRRRKIAKRVVRLTRFCDLCGDPYAPRKEGQRYCSDDCSADARRAKAKAQGNVPECRYCHREMPYRLYKHTRDDGGYCSPACREDDRLEKLRPIAKRIIAMVEEGYSILQIAKLTGKSRRDAKAISKNHCGMCGGKLSKGGGRKWCPVCSNRRENDHARTVA